MIVQEEDTESDIMSKVPLEAEPSLQASHRRKLIHVRRYYRWFLNRPLNDDV
jgi:hypothetical protein